jgi:hypothetical protein
LARLVATATSPTEEQQVTDDGKTSCHDQSHELLEFQHVVEAMETFPVCRHG